MDIKQKVLRGFMDTLKSDKPSVYYILYYTLLEGVLALSIPLTSSFVINSLVAHSQISLLSLGSMISIIFVFIVFIRLLKEYIIEKFEQRVFVNEGYEVALKAFQIKKEDKDANSSLDKVMNYFFDITTIQKTFPVLVLNGTSLFVQTLMALILLLVFDTSLFFWAAIIIFVNLFIVIFLGKDGINYAVERSDTKHNSIYFLQKIPYKNDTEESMLHDLEKNMDAYVVARQNQYGVRIKQLASSFIAQGVIITGFFIIGGHLVINGSMAVGEFVAAEIIILSLIHALNAFAKQLDYIYDGIEGFYKVEMLSNTLDHEKKSERKNG